MTGFESHNLDYQGCDSFRYDRLITRCNFAIAAPTTGVQLAWSFRSISELLVQITTYQVANFQKCKFFALIMTSSSTPVTALPSEPVLEALKDEEGDDPLASLDALEKEALEFKRVRLYFPLKRIHQFTENFRLQDSEIDRILKAFQLDA